MDENIRFIEVLDALKNTGRINDYVQAASTLGTNKAGISDIKSGRKKLSIELLRRMKISYPEINLEWVIMGEGNMFSSQQPANTTGFENKLLDMLQNKDNIIREQAEEIGQLRERISVMERRRGVDASDVPNSGIASVG